MREAVICSPLRTPVGKYGGVFRDLSAVQLAAAVISAIIERTKIDPSVIDDCVFGQCSPSGEAPAIGRVALLEAGLPVDVPGIQIDRRCASGLQAICFAATMVETGAADVVIAGGVESMSNVEFYSTQLRWNGARGAAIVLHDRLERARITAGGARYPVPGGMIETAENLRRTYGISRQAQDEFALVSHERATRAWDCGRFDDEVVPIHIPRWHDTDRVIGRDENPRGDSTLTQIGALRPILHDSDPEATVTAANSSGQNDAAAACIVTTRQRAEELGLRPMGRIAAWAVAGVHPAMMGLGAVPATQKVFEQTGMSLDDMDIIELNEAFAAQVLAVTREWDMKDADLDRMNPNGSSIAIGHPVGATGARILTTLLHEMDRQDVQFGLEAMCAGGGQGIAAIIERIKP